MRRRAASDDGSVSLETAIVAPGALLFLLLIIFGGRVAIAGQAVQHAAHEAARTASIARTQPEADRDAHAAATETLQQQGLQCLTTQVTVDTTGFARPAGTPATVTATVRCDVRLSDLAAPGFPGSRLVTASASSPLDTYRER